MKYNHHPGSAHGETASCLRALSRFMLDLGLKPVLSAPGNSNDWGELRAATALGITAWVAELAEVSRTPLDHRAGLCGRLPRQQVSAKLLWL